MKVDDSIFLFLSPNTKAKGISSLFLYIVFVLGIARPCAHLQSTLPTSTCLHLSPPIPFQSLLSSLQHPQRYQNQNIARNWAIFPNLTQTNQSCLFFLKIGIHDILVVLILHSDLDFWNYNSKIHFWANFPQKYQNCPFWLKIDKLQHYILFWANLGWK